MWARARPLLLASQGVGWLGAGHLWHFMDMVALVVLFTVVTEVCAGVIGLLVQHHAGPGSTHGTQATD